jgi:hypothetical protein
MKGRKVFEGIRLFATDESLLKIIGNPEKTVGQWNKMLKKELTQDTAICHAMKSWVRKKDIYVKCVVGDVLAIEIWFHSDLNMPGAHEPRMMYVNATGLDMIFQRMRKAKGRELQTFAEEYNKNYHEAYQAAVLIIGWLQRTPDKKKKYTARREWRRLMKCHTPEKQNEIISIILQNIQDSEARNELLSWRKL